MVVQILIHHFVLCCLSFHICGQLVLHVCDVRVVAQVRHPRSHVDDLVNAELLGGISLLLPADTDLLQTPLEGELGLNLLLLAQGKTLLHQLDPLGGPRSRSVLCCVVY